MTARIALVCLCVGLFGLAEEEHPSLYLDCKIDQPKTGLDPATLTVTLKDAHKKAVKEAKGKQVVVVGLLMDGAGDSGLGVRVFLNNPKADRTTELTRENGWIGSRGIRHGFQSLELYVRPSRIDPDKDLTFTIVQIWDGPAPKEAKPFTIKNCCHFYVWDPDKKD